MLTERQLQLLEAIIEEYLSSAEPVGSVEIVRKYDLSCSAATVRNEMARLIDMGFLQMMHTSSGRVPTKMAYRVYLDNFMDEDELPVLQEVALKQRLWPNRYQFEKMLSEAVKGLAESTQYLAVATSSDGYITNAGAVQLLDNKEFWDIDITKAALTIAEHYELMERVFSKAAHSPLEVICLIEDDIGFDNLDKCALVFSNFNTGNKTGHIGVLGPSRMNYSAVIPAVKQTKKLIEELGGAW